MSNTGNRFGWGNITEWGSMSDTASKTNQIEDNLTLNSFRGETPGLDDINNQVEAPFLVEP